MVYNMKPKNNRYLEVVKDFTARYYNDRDYALAKKWWYEHNQDRLGHNAILNKGLLSTTGVVIEQSGEPVAMCWVHLSNSKLAQISWMVTRPKMGPRARIAAITKAIEYCEAIAYKHGYKYLQIQSDRKALTDIVHASGFTPIKHHSLLVKTLEDDDV